MHTAPSVAVPAPHEGARHCVLEPGYVQAVRFVPLQAPPQRLLSVAHWVREPWGLPVTGEQVPTAAATSQASHSPVQAALQHTPSAQMPDTHEFPAVQVLPFGTLAMQTPLLHQFPTEQSVSVEHDVRHAVAPQT